MDMHFVGDAFEFTRNVPDSGLNEENVGKAAFSGLSVNLLRDFRQRPGACIDSYAKAVGIAPGTLVCKETVARPYVDDHSACGRGR
jgi:hypothetical protein